MVLPALHGTFGAAFQRLKISVKWLALDDASKRKNTRLIEEFLELRVVPDHPLIWRNVAVKNLRRIHVEELLGRFIATPIRPSIYWWAYASWSMSHYGKTGSKSIHSGGRVAARVCRLESMVA
ncbi:MAG: hypothetical protein EOQ50_21305 [Mesorhizobium sp.]|uniref:hypothetical protein n=1 Tax=Mesorhizobium sp. TaxID=1871066 RepID=UPI000FEA2321|nr:hypothetical protein [Mesorhizobium sp.]RWB71468.1 MAG: hypothetical protein EOQ50_21305 [Mesorhizobium sp.]